MLPINDNFSFLRNLNRSQLVVVAKKVGIKMYWRMPKERLIIELSNYSPELLLSHLHLTLWNKYSNHIYGIAGLIGLVLTIIFAPPFWSNKKSYDRLSGIDIKENFLVGFDVNGNEWRYSFQSKISKSFVAELEPSGTKIILVGFTGEGKDNSQVKAFDEKGNELWSYVKEQNYAYYGSHTGRFNVVDLKYFSTKDGKLIAAIFNDVTWYQSALVILSINGKKLKELWHPGHLQQVEYYKDVFFVRGINNDLRQTSISTDPYKNFYVVFGIKYNSIYGAAPPLAPSGMLNRDFSWYYILLPQGAAFTSMESEYNTFRLWTDKSKGFYFDENGQVPRIAYGDGPTSDDVRLLKYNF